MKCQSLEKHTTRREKGHSHPAHRNTVTHGTVMDGNNIFIGASGRQSFHPRVQTPSRPRAKQKLDWWGEIFQRALKIPHLKTSHMSEVVNWAINSSLGLCQSVCVCVCVSSYRPVSVKSPATFPLWGSAVDGKMSPTENDTCMFSKKFCRFRFCPCCSVKGCLCN